MIDGFKKWMRTLVGATLGGTVEPHEGAHSFEKALNEDGVRALVHQVLSERGGNASDGGTVTARLNSTPTLDVTTQLTDALSAIAGAINGKRAGPTTIAVPIAISISDWSAKHSVGWTTKSAQEFVRIANQFAEYLEPKGIHSLQDVESKHVEAYVRYLLKEYKLPFKRKGKEVGLTPKTVTKHIDTLSGLFKWAQTVGRYSGLFLPTKGQRFGKKVISKTSESWLPLTLADIALLFAPEEFLRWAKKPHQYFVMLIMLLHGLRVSEASQLATVDFYKMQGLWALRICEDVPNSSLKTEATRRVVPLHPALVRLGLLRYLDDVRRVACQ